MDFDKTSPSSARIYDYLIGGTHNFEVDRVVGRQIEQTMPIAAQSARLNRMFLSYAAQQLVAAGFRCYIDLASGLPTEGALHEFVPSDARVIYNDRDPEVVAYSREIIGDRPHIRFIQAQLEEIDTILAAIDQFSGGERRVGLCLIGVVYFIDDESLARIFQRLYEWAAPGSLLVLTSFDYLANDEASRKMKAAYESGTGLRFYPRPQETMLQLVTPWQPYPAAPAPFNQGFQPIENFVESEIGTAVANRASRGRLGYAGLLHHP